MEPVNLFVYGTLKDPRRFEWLLERKADTFSCRPAILMHYIKINVKDGYPFLLPYWLGRTPGKLVSGVFKEDIPALDKYECTEWGLYERKELEVISGCRIKAIVYVAGPEAPIHFDVE